jgi:hypothetical protein
VSRIRSIKPEFWTDGAMIGLSAFARLLYIGSWNFACDGGHLPDDGVGLVLKVLPADNVDPDVLLGELLDAGRFVRITLPDRRTWLSIPRFGDHQKLDKRWAGRCPACSAAGSILAETPRDSPNFAHTHPASPDPAVGVDRSGVERSGGEWAPSPTGAPPSPFCPLHPNGTDGPCRACGDARRAVTASAGALLTLPTYSPTRGPEPDECKAHKYLAGFCVHCGDKEGSDAWVLSPRF